MNNDFAQQLNRRTFLGHGAAGLGLMALNSLINPRLFAAAQAVNMHVERRRQSFGFSAPKAKRVIFLYQAGGPSHLETFDYKPKLAELNGKPMPESMTKGQQIAQLQGAEADLLRPDARIQTLRQIRPDAVRTVSAHGQHYRRDLHDPLDVDRADQS